MTKSFSYEIVLKYIERIQKESYCMTAEYFIEIKNEEWYIKSIEHGAYYDLYSHPCIPYIERLECEEDNDELFKFLKSVFRTHTLNVDQNNKDTMFRVAEEMYNKL